MPADYRHSGLQHSVDIFKVKYWPYSVCHQRVDSLSDIGYTVTIEKYKNVMMKAYRNLQQLEKGDLSKKKFMTY